METKHTPAPWTWFSKLAEDGTHIQEEGFRMRFLTGSNGQGFAHTVGLDEEQDLANTRLICAAPQLLEALRRLLASHKDLIWSLDNGGRPDMKWTMEIQGVAEETIALATQP